MVQSINNKKLAHDIAIDLMLIPCSLHFIRLRFSAENVGGYLIYTERNKARRLGGIVHRPCVYLNTVLAQCFIALLAEAVCGYIDPYALGGKVCGKLVGPIPCQPLAALIGSAAFTRSRFASEKEINIVLSRYPEKMSIIRAISSSVNSLFSSTTHAMP